MLRVVAFAFTKAKSTTKILIHAEALASLPRRTRSPTLLLSLAAVLALPVLADATSDELATTTDFDLSAQPLGTALKQLADQAGIQILFEDKVVGDLRAPALKGRESIAQALETLLSHTNLEYTAKDQTVAVRKKTSASSASASYHSTSWDSGPGTAEFAQTDTNSSSSQAEAANTTDSGQSADSEVAESTGKQALAEVVVTGTNIKGANVTALPISTLDTNAFRSINATEPGALLNDLPQVPNAPLNESANASYSARGDFEAVNLRGIGTGNTLVLLNGYRLVPHAISSTDENGLPDASVNINQLPTSGLDHIDILRDGASSIYGTDAVAGVVNYVTNNKFQGLEASGRVAANEHGNGVERAGSLDAGFDFSDKRGHLVSFLDYYGREAAYLRDQSFTANGDHTGQAPPPWNTASALIPLSANPFYGLQTTGTYPAFKIGGAATNTYLVPGADGNVTLSNTAPVRGVNNAAFFNLNSYQVALPSSNRFNWFNHADYEIEPTLTAFAEASVYHADSALYRQPIAYNSGNFTDAPIVVPASSQFNPYGRPVTLVSEYLTNLGPERDEIADSVYRVMAGVRGEIGNNWSWESAAYYSQGRVTDTAHNVVRQSLFADAIQNGTYNPFGYTFTNQGGTVAIAAPYTNPASAAAPFISEFQRRGVTSLTSGDAHATGQVVDLWSGPISVAVGAEVRRETFSFYMPPYAGLNPPGSGLPTDDNDFLLFGPAANWSGSRVVSSLYAETTVPLVAPRNDIPLIRSLDLTASGRFEHYSDFGSTTKPKLGLAWRPVQAVLLRASYNQGFRAPNLPLLDGGQRKTLQGGVLDPLTNVSGPAWSILTGNPNLKPEDSTGKSFGIVVDVPELTGLTVSADYWQIRETNLITSRALTDILAADSALINPIIAANPGVPFSQLNLASGTSGYKGSPLVIRNSDNSLYGVLLSPYNAALSFTSGVDLSAHYQLPPLPIGNFSLRTDWAFMGSDYQYASAGAPRNDLMNLNGVTRWRGNFALDWHDRSWSAGISGYYIGPFQDSSVALPTSTPAQLQQSSALYHALGEPNYIAAAYNALGQRVYRYVVSSTTTFNAYLQYNISADSPSWLRGTTFRLGVVDLTNVYPPQDGGYIGYRTTVYTGLFNGRTWTLDLKKRF